MSYKDLNNRPIITGAMIEQGYRNARRERAKAFSNLIAATSQGLGTIYATFTGNRGEARQKD